MTEARRERKPRKALESLFAAIDDINWIVPEGTLRGHVQVKKSELVKVIVRAYKAEREMFERKETPDAGR